MWAGADRFVVPALELPAQGPAEPVLVDPRRLRRAVPARALLLVDPHVVADPPDRHGQHGARDDGHVLHGVRDVVGPRAPSTTSAYQSTTSTIQKKIAMALCASCRMTTRVVGGRTSVLTPRGPGDMRAPGPRCGSPSLPRRKTPPRGGGRSRAASVGLNAAPRGGWRVAAADSTTPAADQARLARCPGPGVRVVDDQAVHARRRAAARPPPATAPRSPPRAPPRARAPRTPPPCARSGPAPGRRRARRSAAGRRPRRGARRPGSPCAAGSASTSAAPSARRRARGRSSAPTRRSS